MTEKLTSAQRIPDERANFEQYILSERGEAYLAREEEGYSDDFVQEAWEAWQARAAIAQPANSFATDDAADAAKWRALRNCPRITAMGSAGLIKENPNNYAHLTLNFWTVHDAPGEPFATEWLDQFVQIAQRAALQAKAVPDTAK
jgi:hypothetical protein